MIFTELLRCGEIGTQAIRSFHAHHNHSLHIFAGPEDVQYIPQNPNNIVHVIDPNSDIYQAFRSGHKGTALLWATIFTTFQTDAFVHFDSDVYFCGNVVDDILKELESHDIVGSFRPYKLNPNSREDVRSYPDAVQTYCFGFKTRFLTEKNLSVLQPMVQGLSWKHPVIDFFDPVTFHMLENGATLGYLDPSVIGGVAFDGTRKNGVALNTDFDVGKKIIHFAGVGSGKNFAAMMARNERISVPSSYVQFGLTRYDAYSRIFFGKGVLATCSLDISAMWKHIRESCPFGIFYINLDERRDRRECVEKQLNALGMPYERFPAIKHRKGLIGCVRSHIQCLTLAKERNMPSVLIVEDDAEFLDIQACKSAPLCDVAVLGGVYSSTGKRLSDKFITGITAQTTVAYICHAHYYDTLIANFEESCKLLEQTNIGDSYALDQYWKRLQAKDNWVFAYPILVKQRPDFSNIENKQVNYDSAYLRSVQLNS